MYVPSWVNLNNLPFSFNISETQFSNGHFSNSNRICSRITLLKMRQILHLTLLPMFLGSHRSCSTVLTHKVIALPIAIQLSHMFYLAFATSKNLFIIQATLEDHIMKFGRLQFVEQKCQLLNINVNC